MDLGRISDTRLTSLPEGLNLKPKGVLISLQMIPQEINPSHLEEFQETEECKDLPNVLAEW